MAINTFTYEAPVRRAATYPELDYEELEAAGHLAEEGRSLDALMKTLAHLFPGKPLPDLTKQPFVFTQGSSQVVTKIDGDDLVISTPLVRLSNDGRAIAAMRHVLTRISATGQLYQPRLDGDDLRLEYRDRMARLHPAKVLEVLTKMPEEADNNDDFLTGQFGAQPLDRSSVTPVTDEEFAQCKKIWDSHWTECEELLKDCQKKRSMFFLNELTSYAIHRIRFAIPLVGFISWKLDDLASTFNDGHEDPLKRETSLAKAIKEMRAVTPEAFRASLGHTTYALAPLEEGTDEEIDNYLGDYSETVEELKKEGKSYEAALGIYSTYNFLLGYYYWEEPIRLALQEGLAKASGKGWKEMVAILLEHSEQMVEKFGGSDDDEDEDNEDEDDEDEDEDDEDEDEDDEDDEDEDGDDE
ncbi:MAG: hypothetical protein U0270_24350 [Labilithrix sp.]